MPEDTSPYRDTFQRYLLTGIALTSAAVAQNQGVLDSELREQALHTLDLGLGAPAAWQQARELLFALAPHMEQLGAREEWMEFLMRGRVLAVAHQDQAAEIECMLQLAFLHQLRGNLAEARTLLEGALAKLAAHEYPRLRAAVLNRAAFVAYLQGRYAEASTLASTAQSVAPPDAVAEIAQNEFVWGVLAQTHHEWLASKDHFLEALRLSEAHSFRNSRMIAWGMLNLGTAHRRLEEEAQALECYARAVELLEQIGDRVHAAVARMNIGNLHLLAERPRVALEWYQAAEPVFRQVRDEVRLALIYINMGIAWRDAGDYARAEVTLQAGIKRTEMFGSGIELAEALGDLARLYTLQKRNAEAEAVLRYALALVDPNGEGPELQELATALERQLAGLELGSTRLKSP